MKKKLLKLSIVGKTNVGKSTLINKLVGEKISIVNKKINTTEDLISGILNINHHQLIFFDTPGLNFDKQKIRNKKLSLNFWNGLNQSDLIIYLLDSNKLIKEEIRLIINKLLELKKNIIIVFNKNDLINKKKILPIIKEIDEAFTIKAFFSISAKRELGIKQLVNFLLKNTYESEWVYEKDHISNKDEIFITNECTRDAVLSLIHKEIPYRIKVNNKIFKYLKNGDLKIKQDILINNIRYKKIILGKNGSTIKNIRLRSQSSISKVLNKKIHLYINVNSYND
tara:strand:- start:467 stop:1312 length:846 start_codon:yes stop_codon:yes gene_type:complete